MRNITSRILNKLIRAVTSCGNPPCPSTDKLASNTLESNTGWSIDRCHSDIYRNKHLNVVRILDEWFEPHGGLAGKDVLEFGCGEGTVALGLALQKKPSRVVGVEILDVFEQCFPLAQENLGLHSLPKNLELHQIVPGQDLSHFGMFDCIYSWSVFEHVTQDLLPVVFKGIKSVLKPNGTMLLQISPLYYSCYGSHLSPWIPIPWGHLTLQNDVFYQHLMSAEETPNDVRSAWAVYIPIDAKREIERRILWETYSTLNKVTAPQLARIINGSGLKIVRDYRTVAETPVPKELSELFSEDILKTEQIVWMLQHA
jgi:SAM-dependent methyltransferase